MNPDRTDLTGFHTSLYIYIQRSLWATNHLTITNLDGTAFLPLSFSIFFISHLYNLISFCSPVDVFQILVVLQLGCPIMPMGKKWICLMCCVENHCLFIIFGNNI